MQGFVTIHPMVKIDYKTNEITQENSIQKNRNIITVFGKKLKTIRDFCLSTAGVMQ
jgi:hypothetical protein